MSIKNGTTETIISELINHYIYKFGAPKNILSDQGQHFLSELMQQFKEALNIQHVKTTAFHPQANGNIERMHSKFKNLIKTSMKENAIDWDVLNLLTSH